MRKTLWGAAVGLMALSLIVAACGPAAVPTAPTTPTTPTAPTTPTTPTAPAEEKPQKEAVAPAKLVPKYGGILTRAIASDPTRGWDPTKAQAIGVSHMQWTSNELLQGDWTKGPQGSGETDWQYGFLGDVSLETGELAESWEFPDDNTIIFHLVKGAKYHNRPPANGREVTAQDVVWNMIMQFNYPTAWQTIAYPPAKPAVTTDTLLPGGDPRRPTSIKALDKYRVEIKVPAESQALMFLEIGDNAYTNPPEIWVGTGAGILLGMVKWDKVVGSGQFIVTNFVPGSVIEYSKNPDYFETDPLYPGNKWPYLDMVRQLIIPDLSTRQAAFRVGKIDILTGVVYDDKEQFLKQRPVLQWKKQVSTRSIAAGRLDKPELPFKDIRVRQALNMAIDKEAYLRDYLKGDGDFLGYPYPSEKSWAKFYTPLEEMPKVKELFTYNPQKAKQLLKEAGYPNGFKATIYCSSTASVVDDVSILKDQLSKIGIELTIKPLETAVFSNMLGAKSYEEMWYGSASGIWAPHEQLMTKKGMRENFAINDDLYYVEVGKVIARDIVKNPENYFKVMKGAGQYELESAWGIFMPVPYSYNLWWPWVENYMGINWTGWAGSSDWHKSIWIDTTLKKSMGY